MKEKGGKIMKKEKWKKEEREKKEMKLPKRKRRRRNSSSRNEGDGTPKTRNFISYQSVRSGTLVRKGEYKKWKEEM